MDTSLWKCVTTLTTFLISCLQISNVNSLAVMSVDIGSEWIKVATVLPGVPLEIAINESKGKIPSVIALDKGELKFGEDALILGVHSPSNCYAYFLDLLGKKIDNPVVDLYKKRFPYYSIIPHPKRNTVLFNHCDSDIYFSPEELVAMLLEQAKKFAQHITKHDINEAIISVPGYFGQAERSAILKAAEIAGIQVLQLINSYTAAALNYGALHVDSFHETSPVYMMFYDMGAYDTQVSIVSYQLVNSEDETVTELQPQLTVLGVGYDRTLGGLEIQLRLRNYLASKFNSLQLTSYNVTKSPNTMAKLFIEAGRLKNALSANTDHLAYVKNLIDEKDMEIKVTREELEELCKDLFDKVVFTAQRALDSSGLNIELIEQVILVGTGTEVPRVQDRLVKDLKLKRLLNTNGFVVSGAAHKAASLRNGFEVKPFITKDATLFPIQVTFDEEVIDGNKPVEQIKHILFGHMNPYPQRKIITFNKQQRDFDFTLSYTELNHLDENEVRNLGSLTLTNISLNGVRDAYYKYQGQEGVDTKGIEAHFLMDDSGLLVLHSAELLVEKTVTADTYDTVSVSDSKKNLKVKTIKEAIDVKHEHLFVTPIEGDELQNSINKITTVKEIDLAIDRKKKSLNTLLTVIYETRSKLSEPFYASATTDIEMKSIMDECNKISIWLRNNSFDVEAELLDSKFDYLKKLVTPIWKRTLEHTERPPRLEALNSALKSSNLFLKEIKMTALDETPFTQNEIDTFEELISEITNWRDDQVERQEKLPKNVDPVLTIESIEVIHSSLERELSKFTSWKLKIKEPKAPELHTADEKAKTPEEQDSDTIVKTKASLDDSEEDSDADEAIITIEDVDMDSEYQFKTDDFKYFKPIVPIKTDKKDGNNHTEL